MSNITRYDPFGDLNDVFKGLFLKPMHFDIEGAPQLRMKVDVTKTDDAYTVKADLPGVKKEDIHVSVDGPEVTIRGEVKKETEQKQGEEVIRSERYAGTVSRSFTLPHEVDEARVDAKYADGVLNLTLPVKSRPAKRTIAVN